jgi:glycosyltransferase involved in cell wall biosynthesis
VNIVKILILVDCYFPGTKSGAKLTRDLAVELSRHNHDVTVLTPSEAVLEDLQITREDGVTVIRVRAGKIKGTGKITRALREIQLPSLLWTMAGHYLKNHPCDLIVFYSPTIFFGSLVRKLKALWGCPAYLVLRDIFPQWAVDAGILRKGLVYWYFRFKELQQYKEADVIGVLSPANLKYFADLDSRKVRSVEVLYNWTLVEDKSTCRESNYRSLLKLQGKVVFFYGGNIGVAQGMDSIIRLAERLSEDESIFFLLVGEGSETERLKKNIETLGLRNISIHEAVSQSEYLAMLSEFDVGLISLDRNLKTHNLPGKMLGYMEFAMPMLASINPENDLKDMLDEHKAGLVSINGDDEMLYQHAIALAKDAALRRELGLNGQKLLNKYFTSLAAVRQILSHTCSERIGQDAALVSQPVASAVNQMAQSKKA